MKSVLLENEKSDFVRRWICCVLNVNTEFSQRIFVVKDLSMVFPNWRINILLNSVLQNIDPVENMYFIPLKKKGTS